VVAREPFASDPRLHFVGEGIELAATFLDATKQFFNKVKMRRRHGPGGRCRLCVPVQ